MSFVFVSVSVSQLITSIWPAAPLSSLNFYNFPLALDIRKRVCCLPSHKFAFRISNNDRATFLRPPPIPQHMSEIFCVHHFFNLENINLFIIKSEWHGYESDELRRMTQKIIISRWRRRSSTDSNSTMCRCKILISDGANKKASVKLLE